MRDHGCSLWKFLSEALAKYWVRWMWEKQKTCKQNAHLFQDPWIFQDFFSGVTRARITDQEVRDQVFGILWHQLPFLGKKLKQQAVRWSLSLSTNLM